ncbi:MAG TPA: hypothetical protein VFS25_08360 [Chitinophaga sp.]|uniref:hypothetical protein n=1 Tax=Chitinophaga sp. TaxID=1869181 RepID=UPI002DB80B9F|nr:hypothetical protein [Chitinophaga sp.]HEU4552832.1 hypothetical protein [Chitinophaga sp.]
MTQYRVKTALRLRSAAAIEPGNIIAVLPQDTLVTETTGPQAMGWVFVNTTLSGRQLQGFVSSAYLDAVAPDLPDITAAAVQEVHMQTAQSISRSRTSGRSYPLNEPNMPMRTGTDALTKANQLWQIINFLDVVKSPRYLPANKQTFCNIYAYDYCYLAKAYLPRVWWSGKALTRLAKGETVPVTYGDTINEITANGLYNWFNDFGDDFGWQRMFDLTAFQEEVNKGKVGIIVAQRTVLSLSGHIVAVIPEDAANKAIRVGGQVTMVLQSQAGAKNKRAVTSQWYLSSKFRGFGCWLHE